VFGDGVTPTKYPTKLPGRGYSFDGGDYFETAAVTIPSTTECTFACVIDNYSLSVTDYIMSLASDSHVDIFGLILIVSGALRFYSGATSNWAYYTLSDTNKHTVIGVHDSEGTKIYVDGIRGTDAVASIDPVLTGSQHVNIGSNWGGSSGYNGDMYQSLILPIGLSTIQVQDLHLQMLERAGWV